VIRTPLRASNANPYAERWVRTVCEECLDERLISKEIHLRRVMRDYIDYYNAARPHEGIDQQTHVPEQDRKQTGSIHCRSVLEIRVRRSSFVVDRD
jgi:putative transposase